MIRKAGQDDCQNLAALSLQVWLHTYATQGLRDKISQYALATFTEGHYQQLIDASGHEILLFIENNHLVGFVVIDLDSRFKGGVGGYEIARLYVSEHFHGRGIGRALIEEAQLQYGLPCWLSVWVESHSAIAFYRKLGFEQIGNVEFNLEGELHENHVYSLGRSEV